MIWLLLILGGVLTAMTQMFEALAPLAFVSMIPAVIALVRAVERKARYGKVYLIGLAFALPYFLTVFHWFFYLYPLDFMGVTPTYALLIILSCWLGLSLLQGTTFPFFGVFFRQCSARPKLMPLLFASVWTFSEWLQTLTWAGVPWARLSLSQTNSLAMIQSANLFGGLFITFLIAWINGILGVAICRFMDTKEKKEWRTTLLPAVVLSVAILVANRVYGLISIAIPEQADQTVSVGLIQGNIASGDKWDPYAPSAIDVYLELSQEAVDKGAADVILWPETVITYAVKRYPSVAGQISRFAEDNNVHVFVGTFEKAEGNSYNAVTCFFPDGTTEKFPYCKQRLVPFGEFLPLEGFIRTCIPTLANLNLFEDPLTPGADSAILDTPHGKIGRLICFDSIYENLTRKSVADGAEIVLLSTNDSWYLDSPAVYQHNAHAQLRAVESGRTVLRAANTGISSIITHRGEVTDSLPPLVSGVIVGEVNTFDHRTVYSYVGDLWVLLCFGVMMLEAGTRVTRWARAKKKAR